MTSTLAFRAAATLLLAFAAALLCRWLHTPIPWTIGPLLATSIATVLGRPTRSLVPFRNAGQAVIGCALGLYFTPSVTGLVASLWWAILAAIAWTLGLGWLFARWLDHQHGVGDTLGETPRQRLATSYFAGTVGGASEMTLYAEREGGKTDLVAAAHSLRILMVTLTVPFALSLTGWHGTDTSVPGARNVDLIGLVWLAAAASAGILLMRLVRAANPWFMGPLIAAMGLTMAGVEWSALPPWLPNAAQLVIGVSLGVRFSADFVQAAPRWLLSVASGTLAMILLSAAFAWLLAHAAGLNWATMILGTSPGGIAEMAITARAMQLGVPVVTAFQVCRLVAVLVLVDPLYRWGYARGR